MLDKFKSFKEESGQAMVLFALVFVVLCGFAAFAIDIGRVSSEKSNLQNAADAAALAGAQDLPSATTAKNTAVYYAEQNGVQASKITATTPYNSDSTKIKVLCKRTVEYTFARVLGFTDTEISASAVAQNTKWAGDALPFINLDGDGEDSTKGQPLSAWNKVGPGDKERISNDDLVISTTSIKVNYEDGSIEFKKGKDMSGIKDPLKNIVVVGKTVYIISLKHAEMPNYAKKGSKELKNGDLIPVADTVLLECQVTDGWSGTGSDVIDLKFINSYNWDASKMTYLSAAGERPGGPAKLVE